MRLLVRLGYGVLGEGPRMGVGCRGVGYGEDGGGLGLCVVLP